MSDESKGIPRDAREVYCNEAGEPIAYCPADSIGGTDIARALFYRENEERMRYFAQRIVDRRLSAQETLIVCIDVDDQTWTPLVDALMPGHDWQAIRDAGEHPVARGLAMSAGVAEGAEAVYPAVGDGFRRPLPEGQMRCAVFAAGGVSVFTVRP